MRNVERLKELQNVLNSVPEDQFDLGVWIEGVDKEGKKSSELIGHCGTSACAVGWACTHPKFNEQGLKYGIDDPVWEKVYTPMYNGKSSWDAVGEFFGISYQLSDLLFDEGSYYDVFWCEDAGKVDVKPKDVANRIQIVIDNNDLADYEIEELIEEMGNV